MGFAFTLKVYFAVWVMKVMNVVDRILRACGIKIIKLGKDIALKGLPAEIHEEIYQPDIKLLFEETMKAVENEDEITLFGRLSLVGMWQECLSQRLELKKAFKDIPELSQIQIRKPLFIVGPPRTGTTFLHWLLSRDTRFRSPMVFEQLESFPPVVVGKDYTNDPRYQKACFNVAFRKAFLSKKAYAAHATEADKPEECIVSMLKSFYNGFARFPLNCMDGYSRMIDSVGSAEPMVSVYQYYRKNLQGLAYGHGDKQFLLKAPNHLLHIEALLDVFPDAQLIFTHRRLSQIVPSFLSLNATALMEQYGGTQDLKWRSRILSTLRSWHVCALRTLEKLEEKQSKNPMYVLAYTDLTADPLGEMRKIYDYFGMSLDPETESALVHYLDNDPKKTQYGTHKYTLEEFGLTMEDLKEEFKEYIEMMIKRGKKLEELL